MIVARGPYRDRKLPLLARFNSRGPRVLVPEADANPLPFATPQHLRKKLDFSIARLPIARLPIFATVSAFTSGMKEPTDSL